METKLKLSTLRKLYRLGQSPWYDNIDRRLIRSGTLKSYIDSGIVGLTSNPTIFQKAVEASNIYDEQIKTLSKEGKGAREIYDEITISDVRDAADLLKGIYLTTNGIDGYVSIEVYPEYAHDPKKTVLCAEDIFKRIGRENIMIKVPGTERGCAAVRSLIREGINVNVTLLFSVGHYERAARAYIDGLEDRLKDGNSIKGVASVASLFISRIDTWIDKRLKNVQNESLKGKAACANTKMIYQKFKEIFNDENFGALRKRGGQIQRPLWASTSTKDPAYNDVKYVEELIGKDTINTMPQQTMDAFIEHGEARLAIEDDLGDAVDSLKKLGELKIDLSAVCQEIQDEGVSLFQASFDKLIDTITR
ncbi:MAG: transaldolase [Candidatus Omnitrophica bacterium]|nr:transaldolase [Candidatus Omnitrophota bacterium]